MLRPRIALYLRNAAFAVLALAWSAPFLLVSPAILLPLRRVRPIVDAYLRGIAYLLKHVCGLSCEVRGLERLRGQPLLIAAAHQTTWDILYLPMLLGDPAIVLEDEVFRWPLVGAISRKKGYIPAQHSGDPNKAPRSIEMAKRQSRAGRNILTFPSGMPTGSRPAPPLRGDVAALYEALDVPCVPVALNSSRFWQFRSWLRHPGVITVEILAPIAPGLEKQAFMDTLEARLNRATERLMHEADPPALMAVPTPAARRMAAAMRPAHSAQK